MRAGLAGVENGFPVGNAGDAVVPAFAHELESVGRVANAGVGQARQGGQDVAAVAAEDFKFSDWWHTWALSQGQSWGYAAAFLITAFPVSQTPPLRHEA